MPSASVTLESGWTPAQLRPSCWFEAGKSRKFQSSSGTTASVADSDVVGYLGDLSGNMFDISSAADDTTRPTLQGTGTFPYINFDGTNDILRRTSSIGFYAAGSASWFCAMRSNSNASASMAVTEGSSSTNTPVYCILSTFSSTATTLAGFIRNDANTILLDQTSAIRTSTFDGSDHIVGVVDNGVTATPYFDGVAGTPFTYTARSGSVSVDRFGIGGLQRAAAGSWFAMRMYGFVGIKSAISQSDASRLSTYLARLQGRVI